MRQIPALLLAAILLIGASDAQAPKLVTGADWLTMATAEKEAYIISTVGFLEAKGIPFQQPLPFYGMAMNELVLMPGADKADMATLLLSVVYKDDPRTRPMIDKMKKSGKEGSAPPSPMPTQAPAKSRQRLY